MLSQVCETILHTAVCSALAKLFETIHNHCFTSFHNFVASGKIVSLIVDSVSNGEQCKAERETTQLPPTPSSSSGKI